VDGDDERSSEPPDRASSPSNDPEPDAALIERSRSGDQAGFVELVRRHERRVYNLAYRMLGRAEDARDATQEAFLSAFRHLAGFRGEATFGTWIHRITVNLCYDSLRRRREVVSIDGDEPQGTPTPDHAEAAATVADVQRALLEIPADYRAVVIMHELQDMPVEEVAAVLGVPVGTVKSRLHRGRAALGRALSVSTGMEPHPASPPSKPPIP
jgi:RNA polymerase sigma-70 factor (ECF subfamily)